MKFTLSRGPTIECALGYPVQDISDEEATDWVFVPKVDGVPLDESFINGDQAMHVALHSARVQRRFSPSTSGMSA